MTDSSTAPLSGRALDAKLAEAMGAKWDGHFLCAAQGWPLLMVANGEGDRPTYSDILPHYSTDVSALEPVYEEIERRGLGTEFTAELSLLIWPELPDSVRYDGYAWGILRATPEQHARAALSVLSQEGR